MNDFKLGQEFIDRVTNSDDDSPSVIGQSAPVSTTEPDAVRMLREGMRGQYALYNVNQEYVCTVAPVLKYIDTLRARVAELEKDVLVQHDMLKDLGESRQVALDRVAELERVTEEQVVCGWVNVYEDRVGPPYGTKRDALRAATSNVLETIPCYVQRAALTAARGGDV